MIAYSKVIRIHLDFLKMQPAQSGIGALHVVHVLHCFVQSLQHHFAMSRHFGVLQNSRGGEDVSKRTKISLSPGVNNQNPVSARKGVTGCFS